ncbi:hypothetical protein DUI87_09528 [Hirundo rustica rustica]|uniref:Uncharacterized protein n=1 Tax=Hirundo rustica rustica TaxID=333673 RepID=A0A3M0KMG3_HIRRU|nr:hypothetical protein DUI87_09528 [Hirundo rustica rustica]
MGSLGENNVTQIEMKLDQNLREMEGSCTNISKGLDLIVQHAAPCCVHSIANQVLNPHMNSRTTRSSSLQRPLGASLGYFTEVVLGSVGSCVSGEEERSKADLHPFNFAAEDLHSHLCYRKKPKYLADITHLSSENRLKKKRGERERRGGEERRGEERRGEERRGEERRGEERRGERGEERRGEERGEERRGEERRGEERRGEERRGEERRERRGEEVSGTP